MIIDFTWLTKENIILLSGKQSRVFNCANFLIRIFNCENNCVIPEMKFELNSTVLGT